MAMAQPSKVPTARMRPAKCAPFQCMGNSNRLLATRAESESIRFRLWKTSTDKVATVAPNSASWRMLARSLLAGARG
ncbi:hypothetical protein D9M71_711880 [compost metagenome]